MAESDLEPELDRLYALPLSEFIAARNALAKRLRAGGDRRQADEVKALAKPSVTAWAVNALYHLERRRFDALLEAAGAVRAALAGKGDRREAEAAKRKALRALLGRTAKILADAGHAATPGNRQRISQTLEALAARDPAGDGPTPGRLTTDLEPRGFDVLAGLAASQAPAGPAAASKRPTAGRPRRLASAGTAAAADRDERRQAAGREVAEHERALADLDAAAGEAEAATEQAQARHDRLAEEAAEARRMASAAAKALAAAKADLAAARKASAEAGKARRGARNRLTAARRRLDRLEA